MSAYGSTIAVLHDPDDKRCRAVTVSDSYTTTVARDIADGINSITCGSYLYLEELTFSF